ncbi:hypothetical protein MSTO_17430 [Mycobacterium stomatepiae]|uniref:Uncharacterized protein n=1 Tax=Mycobacterium stomatepiae TaxID=470076 RepID=A0A7I7Q5G6_9MYCO|nr:hypothetical protein MSTO_17430 [Mycobacterium stomatepiae]
MLANEGGKTDNTECDAKRGHTSGRSCVIHILWNGFLLIGDASHELACCKWTAAADSLLVCACAEFGVTCDQAAGSGRVAAENWDRNAEPAMRLTNKLSAAIAAMAGRHPRG